MVFWVSYILYTYRPLNVLISIYIDIDILCRYMWSCGLLALIDQRKQSLNRDHIGDHIETTRPLFVVSALNAALFAPSTPRRFPKIDHKKRRGRTSLWSPGVVVGTTKTRCGPLYSRFYFAPRGIVITFPPPLRSPFLRSSCTRSAFVASPHLRASACDLA